MIRRMSILTALLTVFLSAEWLQGQDTDFQKANQLMQQQNYEEAVPILNQLHEENPQAQIFLDRLLDCLVQLKEYPEALELIDRQLDLESGGNQLLIRKGTIHYALGERDTAFEIWENVIAENRDNIQFYFQVGNALMAHREYSRAAGLYQSARDEFNDSSLFINEIAGAWMQSGNFARAMHEYFRLILENPNQTNFVQQRLLRMQDQEVLDTAAFEIEDFIMGLDISHQSYHSLHQLYMWLLMETEQYQQAFVAARQYESRTEGLNYSLYSLAEQMVANNEHEIAAEAYSYYSESGNRSVRYQAKDRQSHVYLLWANYLSEYNLEGINRREELYREAYRTAVELLEENSSYANRAGVLVRLAEISLDIFHDQSRAEHWIEELKDHITDDQLTNLYYLEGRLHLYNNSYLEARQSFTRANRGAEETDLAEKSRYFLSLTDFFSGDFDFALIQLRSLERRSVSYYANDALQLRMWIQEGQRADTSGQTLQDFASIVEKLYRGHVDEAKMALQPLFGSSGNSLADNALIEISSRSGLEQVPLLYKLFHDYNEEREHSPLRERLLWEQARMGKLIVESGIQESDPDSPGGNSEEDSFADVLNFEPSDWPSSMLDVEELYERLILEFPQGFYAPHARDELQSLTRLRS